jgi:hypothetical protein
MTTSTEEKPREPDAALATYHWMITIQWTGADGLPSTRTRMGTVDVPPGTSRNDVAGDIYKRQTAAAGADPAGAIVLFFTLEPDAL